MALTTDDEGLDDALARRLFAAIGRRRAPSAALARASEIAFRQAFAPVIAQRSARKRRARLTTFAAVAASVAIVAAGVFFTRERSPEPAAGATVARIVRSLGPVEILGGKRLVDQPSAPVLKAGQVLMTGATGRAALDYHGADVRVNVASTVRFGPTRLVLERGAIYVDAVAARTAGEPGIVIETRFGTLGDVGTQFVAAIEQERLTVAVREGTVFLRSDQERHDLSATTGSAQVAEIDASGSFQIHPAPTHDGIWAWVPDASTGFATDGQPADAYLRWLCRERGYALEYRGAASETRAKAAQLHGDLSGLSLDAAIAAVGAITQLDIALDDRGTMSVSSERDGGADPRHDRQ